MINEFTPEELDYLYELLHRDLILSKYVKKRKLDATCTQELKDKFDRIWSSQKLEIKFPEI